MGKIKLLFKYLLLFLSSYSCTAQIGWDSLTIKSHNRLYCSFSFSLAPDFEQSPYNINGNYESDYDYSTSPPTVVIDKVGNKGMRQLTTNFESAGIKIRCNIIQFSQIASLAVSSNPSLGVGFSLLEQSSPVIDGGATGYGSINIPAFLEFSFGGGATRNTPEEYGIFAFAGAEYIKAPLFAGRNAGEVIMDENGNYYYMSLINHWIEPAGGLGVRYRDKKNRLREIFS